MSTIAALNESLAERYRIAQELGQGGMATVYLARDLRHDRDVAIKVLREDLSVSIVGARFLREIKIAAQLQHPHILPLLDSGDAGGRLYFVMPYVKGQSLRERLVREGELPIHEAIRLLTEVADALVEAHSHGVVHRDIKPDNVMLSGRHALVTDFGVAKAISEATGRNTVTTMGVAVGTPTYMSPEQAAADPHVDHRSDVYSVGVMAYEMLCGRPPFVSASPQQVLAAHVNALPDPVSTRRAAVPGAVEHVVMRCLEKRPADRFQTASELLAALEPLSTPSTGTTPAQTRPLASARAKWLGSRASVVAAGAVATIGFGFGLVALVRRPAATANLNSSTQITRDAGVEERPLLSPDGKSVAYLARSGEDSASQVNVRRTDGGDAVRLSGALQPLGWSPAGDRLLVRTTRGVEIMPALGGAPTLFSAPAKDAAWSADGKDIALVVGDSVFVSGVDGRGSRVAARLSDPHSLAWSPNGEWIAVVAGNSSYLTSYNIAASSVWLVPARGGAPIELTHGDAMYQSPTWAPDSRRLLLVSNKDGIRDLYQLAIATSGAPVGGIIRLTTGLNPSLISLSADGATLTYSVATNHSGVWKVRISPDTRVASHTAQAVLTDVETIESISISHDGQWLAFDSDRAGRQQIFRVPLQGGTVEQLTNDSTAAYSPSLSPDGSEVAYHMVLDGQRRIFVKRAVGGAPTRLSNGAARQEWGPEWSSNNQIAWGSTDVLGDPQANIGYSSRGSDGRWSAPVVIRNRMLLVTPEWADAGTAVMGGDVTGALAAQPIDGGAARALSPSLANPAHVETQFAVPALSSDGRTIYLPYLTHAGGQIASGIYAISPRDKRVRDALRFDQPGRSHNFNTRSVAEYGGWLYFTLNDPESDIWIAHVAGLAK